jgi:hypothetical protein
LINQSINQSIKGIFDAVYFPPPQGMNNDFKTALDQVDQDYLNEIIQSTDNSDENQATDVKVKDDGITLEEIQVMSEFFVFLELLNNFLFLQEKAKKLGTGDQKLDAEVTLKIFKVDSCLDSLQNLFIGTLIFICVVLKEWIIKFLNICS